MKSLMTGVVTFNHDVASVRWPLHSTNHYCSINMSCYVFCKVHAPVRRLTIKGLCQLSLFDRCIAFFTPLIFSPCISIISFIDQGLLLCNQRGRPTHLHGNSHLGHFLQQINFFLGLVRLNRILRKWPATSFCKVWQKRSKQWGCQPVISSLLVAWFANIVQFHGLRKSLRCAQHGLLWCPWWQVSHRNWSSEFAFADAVFCFWKI